MIACSVLTVVADAMIYGLAALGGYVVLGSLVILAIKIKEALRP